MTWLWLTLGAQFLFSVGAHVDKYLLGKYFKDAPPGALILYSSLFSFLVLPVLGAMNPAVLAIAPSGVALLLLGGALNITGVILSLYAMQRDEASVVATLFQLVPVCNYLLAWIVLGETLTPRQIGAAVLILAGAVGISLDLTRRRVALKGVVFLLMALASLLIAANAVLFKVVAVDGDFWVSSFWSYVALALVGIVLFTGVKPFRVQFLKTLKVNRGRVLALNLGNELLAVAGYVMISYATLLVPIALVSILSGLQPMMVFLIGAFLTAFLPRLGKEELSRRQIVQKCAAMAVILLGTWLLH